MKVVVIGGTGNISTSIVKLLLEKGHEVTCFNRGKSGKLPKDVRLIQGDRNDRETFEKAMQRENFDAAIDMISFTAEDAASSIRAFRGVSHFIHCSTSNTYGVEYDWLPVSEDHPMRPIADYGRGKLAGDKLLLAAYLNEDFPVTILKPSTAYGPLLGMLRQVSWEFSWIDRIRKGKPIIICGDGGALVQFLHVDDAAKGFVGAIGKQRCIGQVYNIVKPDFVTWKQYHRTAMKILGKEVELVGVPLETLNAIDAVRFAQCSEEFAYNCYYSGDKLCRDVPEFTPTISLEEGMRRVFESMDAMGMIPDADTNTWEDKIIEAQRKVGRTVLI